MRADDIFGVIVDGVPTPFLEDWDFIGKLGEGKGDENEFLDFS